MLNFKSIRKMKLTFCLSLLILFGRMTFR